MKSLRTIAACHADAVARLGFNDLAAKISQPPIVMPEPIRGPRKDTPQMDRQIAEARAEMGEARWAELNKEWEG